MRLRERDAGVGVHGVVAKKIEPEKHRRRTRHVVGHVEQKIHPGSVGFAGEPQRDLLARGLPELGLNRLPLLKASEQLSTLDLFRRHPIHPRPHRPTLRPIDKCMHGANRPANHCLHAPIQPVAHPACEAEALGFLRHVPAVAHALHAAGDAQVAGDGVRGCGWRHAGALTVWWVNAPLSCRCSVAGVGQRGVVQHDAQLAGVVLDVFPGLVDGGDLAILVGQDDVQFILDNLAKSFPQLVQSVLPKIISLPMMTEILRTLLSDGVPISDMRRILEGLGGSAGRGKSPADMAEALRPALAPLLIQKVTALGQTMPVITLAPELEQLMLRTLRQAGDDGLMLDNKLAETLIRTINETSEQLAAQGRPAICVVAPQIRRAFSNFVKPHVPQLIILGFTELPENRHVEVVASIGSTEGLVSPTPQKV